MNREKFLSERTRLISLILIILICGGIIFYALFYLLEHIKNYWWGVAFLIYIFLLEVVNIINKRFHFRFTKIIERMILLPIIVLKLLLDIAKPSIYIIASFLYLVVVAFLLPFSILKGLDFLCNWNLNLATMIFLVFSTGSILCVHRSKMIQSLVCGLPPLNRGEHKFQQLGRDLAVYILHPQNLSFVLYFLYFVYLLISGIIQLQNKGYLLNEEIDGAILKAFLVFIACTNMVSKSHEVDIRAKVLLHKMINLMIVNDDNE